jgi:hypothetical protein
MTQNILILDFGNAFLKSVSTQSRYPIVIPSCIHKLTPAQLRERIDPDEKSPLIKTADASYFVGAEAQKSNGINNWSSDKLQNVLLGVMAVVDRSQRIDQLIVCVPDSSINPNFSHLLGIHSYERNGKQIQLEIADVEAMDETYGIWYGAKNLYHHPDDTNIAITIGAGTFNLTFYSSTGRVLHRAVANEGMSAIAGEIASAIKSKHNLSATPKLGQIMSGMASGKHQIAGSGIDYSIELTDAIANWKERIKTLVIDNSGSGLDYWQFAIGGAGANYLGKSVEPHVRTLPGIASIIVPDPQTFAIESLLKIYEN